MRIARGVLIFVAIAALLALAMSPAADLFPFDVLAPLWFVFAAILAAFEPRRRDDVRAPAAPFLIAAALRAPPLQ